MQNDATLSLVQIFFRNKWVRLILIIDVVILLIFIIALAWQTTKTSTINLNIVPFDSTISINGKSGYNNGEYSITPGTYEVAISHDGLESKTLTIDIPPKHVVSVTTFLSDADKTFGYYKLRENLGSFNHLAAIASTDNNITTDQDLSAEQFIRQFQEDYSIFTTKLPIDYQESSGYGQDLTITKNITIEANQNCKSTLCIKALVVGTQDQEYINNILRNNDINPEDYEIEYKFY